MRYKAMKEMTTTSRSTHSRTTENDQLKEISHNHIKKNNLPEDQIK